MSARLDAALADARARETALLEQVADLQRQAEALNRHGLTAEQALIGVRGELRALQALQEIEGSVPDGV